jgi:outer membrane receptor protein involved in Fe transport
MTMAKTLVRPISVAFACALSAILLFGTSSALFASAEDTDPAKGAAKRSAAQEAAEQTKTGTSVEITVTAPRVEIPLKKNPAATTVVETPLLRTMPRTIAIDEVLKTVPGVKVDNQAGGERVHLSIRGEGILTERGTRGIKTLVDGIPLNDPSGYVPDFYDIDWTAVRRVEVLRGPAAAFYGSGSSGGIINVLTRAGGTGRPTRAIAPAASSPSRSARRSSSRPSSAGRISTTRTPRASIWPGSAPTQRPSAARPIPIPRARTSIRRPGAARAA